MDQNTRQNTYIDLMRKNLETYYGQQLGLKNYERRIQDRLSRKMGKTITDRVFTIENLAGKKVLDVGSGWGEISVELAKKGCIVTGIEPNLDLLNISKLITSIENVDIHFTHGYGEYINFPDDTFDCIVCNSVIEHTKNPARVISEILRTLKFGGFFYLNAPNYLFPYESHYKIFYPPLCPKYLGKIYLKMRRRDTEFLSHLQYVTPYKIFKELKKYKVYVENRAIQKLDKFSFLKGDGLVKRIFKKIVIFFHLYPNIEVVIRKNYI